MEIDHLELPGEEKESGNKYFKEGDYLNASKCYSKALLAFNHLIREQKFPSEEDAKRMIEEIQLPSLLNLAACYLKFGYGYENVVTHCTDALKIQENNLKALYRRATAYIHLDKFEDAKADIEAGLKIDPESKDFSRVLSDLNKKQTAYRNKTKRIAQKAFGGEKKKTEEIPSNTEENSLNNEIPWWKCGYCRRKKKIQ